MTTVADLPSLLSMFAPVANHKPWPRYLVEPDGSSEAGEGRVIRLWDLTTLREKATLKGHKSGVGAVAWSPDGQWIASGANTEASVSVIAVSPSMAMLAILE